MANSCFDFSTSRSFFGYKTLDRIFGFGQGSFSTWGRSLIGKGTWLLTKQTPFKNSTSQGVNTWDTQAIPGSNPGVPTNLSKILPLAMASKVEGQEILGEHCSPPKALLDLRMGNVWRMVPPPFCQKEKQTVRTLGLSGRPIT